MSAKSMDAPVPYEGYKLYGPYRRKEDLYQHVILIHKETRLRKTVSYAKYLVEVDRQELLDPELTVDHLDRNPLNNDLSNLVTKTRAQHLSDDATYVKPITITCIWCGATTQKAGRDLDGNASQGKAGPFCSKRCAGKYGAEIQNGRIDRLGRTPHPAREYYRKVK